MHTTVVCISSTIFLALHSSIVHLGPCMYNSTQVSWFLNLLHYSSKYLFILRSALCVRGERNGRVRVAESTRSQFLLTAPRVQPTLVHGTGFDLFTPLAKGDRRREPTVYTVSGLLRTHSPSHRQAPFHCSSSVQALYYFFPFTPGINFVVPPALSLCSNIRFGDAICI